MDNLTHSVVGLAVGELVERSLPLEPDPVHARVRRRLLLTTCWAASNFPDLDLLLMPFVERPLGYLLHHRGHTHTLLYALPQALALLALLWLCWPAARALLRSSAPARVGVVLAAAVGLLLHLSMDYLNSYGVHPFAPFDGRWLYGDMIYILEPVFWVACGVPLAMSLARPALRHAVLALLAGVLLLCAVAGFLLWSSVAGLALLGVLLAWLQGRARPRSGPALVTGLATALAFVALQGFATGRAQALVAADLAARDPAARLLDVALTAYPANPMCWSFVSVEIDEGADRYRLRRGVASLAPTLLPAAACPARFAGGLAAPAQSAAVALLATDDNRLSTLRQLQQADCRVDQWLRFARTPALASGAATDLRFGMLGSDNFSTLHFDRLAGQPCPPAAPAWGYPRADLLSPPAAGAR